MKFRKPSERHSGTRDESKRDQRPEKSAQSQKVPSQAEGDPGTASVDRHIAQSTGHTDQLKELLVILVGDIRAWSSRCGYDAIPAIEVLRQVTSLAEAVEYAQRRDGAHS